ncbi:hypothetical protein C8J56DRAFT_1058323 [Mycena floridula]|nr:hypothetical protein C8J56DRAFT_1058323 [Mycena floridula]
MLFFPLMQVAPFVLSNAPTPTPFAGTSSKSTKPVYGGVRLTLLSLSALASTPSYPALASPILLTLDYEALSEPSVPPSSMRDAAN